MPRELSNWNFKDVVEFLEHHHFTLAYTHGGSHHYYKGQVDGKDRLVEVQFHNSDAIKNGTMKFSIVPKSGIPKEIWLQWARAGNPKLQKKIRYEGAKPFETNTQILQSIFSEVTEPPR